LLSRLRSGDKLQIVRRILALASADLSSLSEQADQVLDARDVFERREGRIWLVTRVNSPRSSPSSYLLRYDCRIGLGNVQSEGI